MIAGEASLLITPDTSAFQAELEAQASAAASAAATTLDASLTDAGLVAGQSAGAELATGIEEGTTAGAEAARFRLTGDLAAAATEAGTLVAGELGNAGVIAGAAAGAGMQLGITGGATQAGIEAGTAIEHHLGASGIIAGTEAGAGMQIGILGGAEKAAVAAATTFEQRMAAAGITAGIEAGAGLGSSLGLSAAAAGTKAGTAAGEGLFTSFVLESTAATLAAAEDMIAVLGGAGPTAGAAAGTGFGAAFLAKATPAIAAVGAEETAAAGLGGALGALAGPAIAAVVGFEILKKGVEGAVHAFEDAEAADIKLRQGLLASPLAAEVSFSAYRKQAASLQQLTGYQDDNIVSADAQLTRFDLTGQQIQQLNPLVLDYAAATGQDVPTAAGALGKALLGATRGLKQVGIQYKTTGSRATDFDNITALLATHVGGLAQKQMSTLAGETRLLSSNFQDLKQSAGQTFVPYLNLLAVGLNGVIGGTTEATNQTHSFSHELGRVTNPVTDFMNLVQLGARHLAASQLAGKAASDAYSTSVGELTTKFEGGFLTQKQYIAQTGQASVAAHKAGVSENDVNTVMAAAKTTADAYGISIAGVAKGHKVAAADAHKQLVAEDALTGGFLGLKGASDSEKKSLADLHAAQTKVDDLRKKGNINTKKGKEAEAALAAAVSTHASNISALQSATDNYKASLDKSGHSTKDVNDATRVLLTSYGLTKKEADKLIGSISGVQAKADKVAGDYALKFNASGLSGINAQLDTIIGNLNKVSTGFTSGANSAIAGLANAGVITVSVDGKITESSNRRRKSNHGGRSGP